MTLVIAAAQARRLVLSLQGLAAPPRRPLSADGLVELMARWGNTYDECVLDPAEFLDAFGPALVVPVVVAAIGLAATVLDLRRDIAPAAEPA